MLDIQGLDVAYGESQVLWDVSLTVPAGGVVCLMGRNGVGKTTLLKTIMGLLRPRSGRIVFDGIDLAGRRSEERSACGIGYVPQGREIFPNLTVAENLRVGALGAGPGTAAGDDLDEIFELFPSSSSCWGARAACFRAASSSSSPSAACSWPGPSSS